MLNREWLIHVGFHVVIEARRHKRFDWIFIEHWQLIVHAIFYQSLRQCVQLFFGLSGVGVHAVLSLNQS